MGAQSMTRLQLWCYWMAVFDILFYFGTIIASVIVENVVSERRPMRFQINDNGTVSVAYGQNDELMAIWDYMHPSHYTSSATYNAVYMTSILIAVSYLIMEVWLSCVLIRGATEKSVVHCKKWFWWRVCILLLTLAVSASDLCQMQYTFTLLIFIPLNLYRIILLIVVLHLVGEMRGDGLDKKMKNLA